MLKTFNVCAQQEEEQISFHPSRVSGRITIPTGLVESVFNVQSRER